jgi:hypothetical protein
MALLFMEVAAGFLQIVSVPVVLCRRTKEVFMRKPLTAFFVALFVGVAPLAEGAGAVIGYYQKLAEQQDSAFSEFSGQRGETLFRTDFSGGKPDTPNCMVCHGQDPRRSGETRVGKPIDPMAASVNTSRYEDLKKTEKWFRRNCKSVLGRECTPQEKGDFISFMRTQ